MTSPAFSKTQIDKLGERLKKGLPVKSDLEMLDDYRSSFGSAYESVVQKITQLGQSPTGRMAKSTDSIVDKLRRESVRLSQMQNIAGCRLVVENTEIQDQLIVDLTTGFCEASVVDRRKNPSHGYRAVHVVAVIAGKPVEIQIRSTLQHLWAELSEKTSDVIDPAIKYGGGNKKWQKFQMVLSDAVTRYEAFEEEFFALSAIMNHSSIARLGTEGRSQLPFPRPESRTESKRGNMTLGGMSGKARYRQRRKQIYDLAAVMAAWRNELHDLLTTISQLDEFKKQKQ